jgi:hypothetical protein
LGWVMAYIATPRRLALSGLLYITPAGTSQDDSGEVFDQGDREEKEAHRSLSIPVHAAFKGAYLYHVVFPFARLSRKNCSHRAARGEWQNLWKSKLKKKGEGTTKGIDSDPTSPPPFPLLVKFMNLCFFC